MDRFGFLPANAMAKIQKVVDKEGWGYVRKITRSKAVKGKQLKQAAKRLPLLPKRGEDVI